jgi:topoisomerase-4 subunit A
LNFDLSRHFNEDILLIEKWKSQQPLTAVYFDGQKECYFIKRFLAVGSDKAITIISSSKGSYLEIISSHPSPEIHLYYVKERGKDRKEENINAVDFIAVKGDKAQGNKLSSKKIQKIELIEAEIVEEETVNTEEVTPHSDESHVDTNDDELKAEKSNDDSKIIIDEDSTDNQFKLEL